MRRDECQVSSEEWREPYEKTVKKKVIVLTFSALHSALCLLAAMLLAVSFPAEAQQPKKIPRIGYLTGVGSAPSKAFLQGLRDLGYIEGKNILIEFRTTEAKPRFPELAAELVRLKVDVIVANTTPAVIAAKNAMPTIPIV